MKYLNPVEETAKALAFLTRLPIPDRFFKNVESDQTSHSAGFYPVAGMIIGAIGGAVLLLTASLNLTPVIVAGLSIIATIGLTGALHEDGLGDVADGFGGGSEVNKRLEIMKDSRLGAYGAIAISGALFLRIAALSAVIASGGPISGFLALVAAAAGSRGAMVWMWSALPNARADGVSANMGRPPESAVSMAAILALGATLIFGLFASSLIAASMALGISILTLAGFQGLCRKMIGGQTGDTLGALQQLVEIGILVGLAMQF